MFFIWYVYIAMKMVTYKCKLEPLNPYRLLNLILLVFFNDAVTDFLKG